MKFRGSSSFKLENLKLIMVKLDLTWTWNFKFGFNFSGFQGPCWTLYAKPTKDPIQISVVQGFFDHSTCHTIFCGKSHKCCVLIRHDHVYFCIKTLTTMTWTSGWTSGWNSGWTSGWISAGLMGWNWFWSKMSSCVRNGGSGKGCNWPYSEKILYNLRFITNEARFHLLGIKIQTLNVEFVIQNKKVTSRH